MARSARAARWGETPTPRTLPLPPYPKEGSRLAITLRWAWASPICDLKREGMHQPVWVRAHGSPRRHVLRWIAPPSPSPSPPASTRVRLCCSVRSPALLARLEASRRGTMDSSPIQSRWCWWWLEGKRGGEDGRAVRDRMLMAKIVAAGTCRHGTLKALYKTACGRLRLKETEGKGEGKGCITRPHKHHF